MEIDESLLENETIFNDIKWLKLPDFIRALSIYELRIYMSNHQTENESHNYEIKKEKLEIMRNMSNVQLSHVFQVKTL